MTASWRKSSTRSKPSRSRKLTCSSDRADETAARRIGPVQYTMQIDPRSGISRLTRSEVARRFTVGLFLEHRVTPAARTVLRATRAARRYRLATARTRVHIDIAADAVQIGSACRRTTGAYCETPCHCAHSVTGAWLLQPTRLVHFPARRRSVHRAREYRVSTSSLQCPAISG